MDLPSLLGLPPRIAIEALCRTSTVLTVSLVSTAVAACCPPLSLPAVPSVAPAPNAATVGINEREHMFPVQGARWCSVCGYDGSFVPTRPAFCVFLLSVLLRLWSRTPAERHASCTHCARLDSRSEVRLEPV